MTIRTDKTKSRSLSSLAELLPILLMISMCVVAFVLNYGTTQDLEWPGFVTQFRELASAQTLLDEGYGPDSTYLNEYSWYNPLPGSIVAFISYIFDIPTRIVVPRIGVYVNLVAPICFFLMMRTLFSGWDAMAGTAGFLFLESNRFEDYEAATYSAWYLPNSFVQALLK